MAEKNIYEILEVGTSGTENKQDRQSTHMPAPSASNAYGGQMTFSFIFAVILLAAGIILPIYLISEIPSRVIERSPEVLIFPVYTGFILLIFAALCGMIGYILHNPDKKTIWLENTLNTFAAIILIIGVIFFFIIISETSGSMRELRNLGGFGAVVVLFIHGLLCVLCAGVASIHNKYNSGHFSMLHSKPVQTSRYCSGCGNQAPADSGQFCQECGNKL